MSRIAIVRMGSLVIVAEANPIRWSLYVNCGYLLVNVKGHVVLWDVLNCNSRVKVRYRP